MDRNTACYSARSLTEQAVSYITTLEWHDHRQTAQILIQSFMYAVHIIKICYIL